jgi:bacillithiol biosynthesis cysteine-adding enzyme BshC
MVHGISLLDIPSTTGFYAGFWHAGPELTGLLPHHFRDAGVFERQARRVDAAHYDRGSLCRLLRDQNDKLGADPAVQAGIARLEQPGALVVIGGQQAGLFGGPLYTLHKAATILALARGQEKDLGRPVIPVFWIASEDSDLEEINHAWITDRDGRLRELRMPGSPPAKIPVSRLQLGGHIGPLIDELAAALPEGGFTAEVLSDLRSAYTPGRTYTQAFAAWMAGLFQGTGLVLVDPSDARLKRLAFPLFEREIAEKSPVSAAALEQTARLEKAGFHAQIELRPGFLTLFHQAPARDAIMITHEGFQLKEAGRRFSPLELAELLQRDPDAFTPNAMLRPLFQDSVFPTLAAVLGPSEIAYWAQLTLAYERMEIPMPIMMPRASFTLVEEKMERLQSRLGVSLVQALQRGEHVIDDILRKEIPATLVTRISTSRAAVEDAWRGIVNEIDSLDPTLHRTSELGRSRSLWQFDFMERKIAQAARKKNVILRGKVERLLASLAPRGGLQERTLCALPFLARHGNRIVSQVIACTDPFAPEHRVVGVDP